MFFTPFACYFLFPFPNFFLLESYRSYHLKLERPRAWRRAWMQRNDRNISSYFNIIQYIPMKFDDTFFSSFGIRLSTCQVSCQILPKSLAAAWNDSAPQGVSCESLCCHMATHLWVDTEMHSWVMNMLPALKSKGIQWQRVSKTWTL